MCVNFVLSVKTSCTHKYVVFELIMATEAAIEATDLEIDRYLQPIEVVNYFVGQVSSTNHDLIKHFRPLLVKSSLGPDNHAILKKITAQLVIVKRIQGKASFSSRYLAVLKISILVLTLRMNLNYGS